MDKYKMGWDWDAVRKGDIIRFWFYDGTGEPELGPNIKLNYNIKTKKVYNVRIYIINKITEKMYDDLAEKASEDDDLVEDMNDVYLKNAGIKKRKGYRDAIKYLKGIPPKEVNNFLNDCRWCIKRPILGKTYSTNGIKFMFLEWGLNKKQLKYFTSIKKGGK